MNSIYADAATLASFHGGIVRINLGTSIPDSSDNVHVVDHSVIMIPVIGFVNMLQSLNELADRMKDAGVIAESDKEI